jgi:adenosylcobinamide-GDP ribazoletransferase
VSAAPPRQAPHATGTTTRARRGLDGAVAAIAFLTIIPVRTRGDAPDLSAAAAWFPLVGALVGGLAGAIRYVAAPLFGAAVASVLALVVLVTVTGALHQDGLADCADGLGVRGDRERRLAVMRDPATGVFGTLALLGWGLLLTAALAALPDRQAFEALAGAAIVGRTAALVHARATPSARPDGLGAAFAVTSASLAIAGAVAILAAVLLYGPIRGLCTAAIGLLVAFAVSAWSRASLGGRTGDTLGATVALVEVAVCLTLLAFATA